MPKWGTINEVAANQKTVYLRFFWRDIFSWYWMVDDIELTEPFAHDLALEKVTSHQETGNTFTKEDVLKVKQERWFPARRRGFHGNRLFKQRSETNRHGNRLRASDR
jgi:hypothetical protein